MTTPLKHSFRAPKTPLKSPFSTRVVTPFTNNDDDLERARLRAQRAKQKLSNFAAVNISGDNSSIEDPGLSDMQLLELYQNCIKLAAENKINQKNSWDLPLIDHLGEIIKGDEDEKLQTNFQKASCTLEAGVKIYSYRVDSVHSEAFKVLNGLNRTSEAEAEKDPSTEDMDGDAPDDDAENSSGDKRKEHKKNLGPSSTLEPSWDTINSKKIDAAFAVDPLFQQTSAQFDEGGAKGLLLHNLSVYRGCEILFDSEEVPERSMDSTSQPLQDVTNVIDVSFLQGDIDRLLASLPMREISPSLNGILVLLEDPRRIAAEGVANDREPELQKEEQPWTNENLAGSMPLDDGYISDGGFSHDDDNEEHGAGDFIPTMSTDYVTAYDQDSGHGDLDGNGFVEGEDEGDVSLWLAAGLGLAAIPNSWAGPQHWKYKKQKDSGIVDASPEEVKVKKQKREPFFIDFYNIPEGRDIPPRAPNSRISLTKASRSTPAETLLPDDHHFDSDAFGKLFLRPWNLWRKKRSRHANDFNGANSSFGDASAPQNDWDGGSDAGADFYENNDEEAGDGEMSGVSDPMDGFMIAQPRKVEKIDVTYARTSKQVDVRLLKETIWENLQLSAAESNQDGNDGVSFQKLLKNFPAECEAAPLEDISVHLCFICVLHLANEHNLAILASSQLDELEVKQVLPGEGQPQ